MKKTIPVPLSILSIPILLAAPYVPLLFLARWTPEEVYFFQPPPLLFRFLFWGSFWFVLLTGSGFGFSAWEFDRFNRRLPQQNSGWPLLIPLWRDLWIVPEVWRTNRLGGSGWLSAFRRFTGWLHVGALWWFDLLLLPGLLLVPDHTGTVMANTPSTPLPDLSIWYWSTLALLLVQSLHIGLLRYEFHDFPLPERPPELRRRRLARTLLLTGIAVLVYLISYGAASRRFHSALAEYRRSGWPLSFQEMQERYTPDSDARLAPYRRFATALDEFQKKVLDTYDQKTLYREYSALYHELRETLPELPPARFPYNWREQFPPAMPDPVRRLFLNMSELLAGHLRSFPDTREFHKVMLALSRLRECALLTPSAKRLELACILENQRLNLLRDFLLRDDISLTSGELKRYQQEFAASEHLFRQRACETLTYEAPSGIELNFCLYFVTMRTEEYSAQGLLYSFSPLFEFDNAVYLRWLRLFIPKSGRDYHELEQFQPAYGDFASLCRLRRFRLQTYALEFSRQHSRFAASSRPVRVAIAAELFFRKYGKWPEKAEELVPEFLSALPVDPFSSRPFALTRGIFQIRSAPESRFDGIKVADRYSDPIYAARRLPEKAVD